MLLQSYYMENAYSDECKKPIAEWVDNFMNFRDYAENEKLLLPLEGITHYCQFKLFARGPESDRQAFLRARPTTSKHEPWSDLNDNFYESVPIWKKTPVYPPPLELMPVCRLKATSDQKAQDKLSGTTHKHVPEQSLTAGQSGGAVAEETPRLNQGQRDSSLLDDIDAVITARFQHAPEMARQLKKTAKDFVERVSQSDSESDGFLLNLRPECAIDVVHV